MNRAVPDVFPLKPEALFPPCFPSLRHEAGYSLSRDRIQRATREWRVAVQILQAGLVIFQGLRLVLEPRFDIRFEVPLRKVLQGRRRLAIPEPHLTLCQR